MANELKNCRFLESYEVEKPTLEGPVYVTSQRCRLGHELPLDGCLETCPDYEPQMPELHKPPIPEK